MFSGTDDVERETLRQLFEGHSTSYLVEAEVYSCRAWELEHVRLGQVQISRVPPTF